MRGGWLSGGGVCGWWDMLVLYPLGGKVRERRLNAVLRECIVRIDGSYCWCERKETEKEINGCKGGGDKEGR